MRARRTVELIGVLGMASCTVMFAALWWVAFISRRPVLVMIDDYNEAYPEAVIWFLLGPLMLFALYSYLARFHPSGP